MESKEEHIEYIENKSKESRKKFEVQMRCSLFSEFDKLLVTKKTEQKEIDNADLS